jgi:hypothetical protein
VLASRGIDDLAAQRQRTAHQIALPPRGKKARRQAWRTIILARPRGLYQPLLCCWKRLSCQGRIQLGNPCFGTHNGPIFRLGFHGRRRRWAPRNNSGLRCQEIALPRTCFLGFALNLVSIAVNHQKIPLDSPTSVSRVFFCIGGIAQAARQQFPVLKDYSGGVTLRRSGQCIESSGHGNS